MVKLEARKKNGEIIISDDSFRHLLDCLDNQKFINEFNADALAMSDDERRDVQAKNQEAIDDFNRQCRALWLQKE